MAMKTLFLNCTPKKSPFVSNICTLVDKAVAIFEGLRAKSKMIRTADHNLAYGVSLDEGEGNHWPSILEKIKAFKIFFIVMPIWSELLSFAAKVAIKKPDMIYMEMNPEIRQYPLYRKDAGIIATGNEDRIHVIYSTILFNLFHIGCAVPQNVDCLQADDSGLDSVYTEAGENRRFLQIGWQ